MKFCTHCGSRLVRRRFDADSRERHACGACGLVHYENPKLLVWCFAHWQARLVLCRRAIEPARGLWGPPSGFVEAGESLEEAVAREAREEAGLELSLPQLVLYRVISLPHMNEVHVGFRVELDREPAPRPGPEVSEVVLFSGSEIPFDELAFREMQQGVPEDFFRYLHTGVFPVFAQTVRP